MSKFKFYLLSFVWGLPMTLIGSTAALILRLAGCKPKKWGYCWRFEVSENWGGVNLGPIFITDKNPSIHTRNHEMGHGIQNCYFGPLMPFIICIPSVIRYWYREYLRRVKKVNYYDMPPYDSFWVEGWATKLGNKYYELLVDKEVFE